MGSLYLPDRCSLNVCRYLVTGMNFRVAPIGPTAGCCGNPEIWNQGTGNPPPNNDVDQCPFPRERTSALIQWQLPPRFGSASNKLICFGEMYMSGVVLIFLMLFGSASLPVTQTPQKVFTGCLNRLPDGTLQFGAVPSGDLFLVGGQAKMAEEHVNQLVRVFGEVTQGGNANNAVPSLMVSRVQELAGSCTSASPTMKAEGVPGKVGEDSVAVPVATTLAEDQTTPGFQTETAATRTPPYHESVSHGQDERPPAAPFHPEQVAQSQAAANLGAGAVERTEILPGHTLGVVASSATTANATGESKPAKSPANAVVVKISGKEAPRLSASTVNIRAGQTIEWFNDSSNMQEIIADPARAKRPFAATLPAGAKPFDSGFLRPDHSYEYRFTVTGVYRYFCQLNDYSNPSQVAGQIVVSR
jgi:plastocyanin